MKRPHRGIITGRGWHGAWLALGFLITGATLGLAEEIVLTSYFPSPRGVYEELRAARMRFNDTAAPPNILWQWLVNTADTTLRLQRTDAGGTPTAEHLTVSNAGNVGVGTTTPQNRLDVEGGAAIGALYAGTSAAPADGLVVQGNVGIGTAAPVSILHLHGNYNNTGAGGFLLDATDVPSDPERYVLRINPFVVGGGMVGYQFQTKSLLGGTQVPLTFDHAGRVGIGTTTPAEKLHLAGTGNVLALIQSDTAAFLRTYDTGGGANSKYFDIINDGGALLFRALNDNNTIKGERLMIDPNGNVGIGTTTPAQRLDVVGNANVSGNLTVGGTISGTFTGTVPATSISSGQFGANAGGGNYAFPSDLQVGGVIRGKFVCREMTFEGINAGLSSVVACNSDEFLMSGGGACGYNGSAYGDPGDEGFMHLFEPWGANGLWAIDCFQRDGNGDVKSRVVVVCCKSQ